VRLEWKLSWSKVSDPISLINDTHTPFNEEKGTIMVVVVVMGMGVFVFCFISVFFLFFLLLYLHITRRYCAGHNYTTAFFLPDHIRCFD
jgi:hypothetical protein